MGGGRSRTTCAIRSKTPRQFPASAWRNNRMDGYRVLPKRHLAADRSKAHRQGRILPSNPSQDFPQMFGVTKEFTFRRTRLSGADGPKGRVALFGGGIGSRSGALNQSSTHREHAGNSAGFLPAILGTDSAVGTR